MIDAIKWFDEYGPDEKAWRTEAVEVNGDIEAEVYARVYFTMGFYWADGVTEYSDGDEIVTDLGKRRNPLKAHALANRWLTKQIEATKALSS